MKWNINILTLFPDMYPGPLEFSISRKLTLSDTCKISIQNIRKYANNKHQSIDDTPYGGGSGMILRADILGSAIEECFLQNNYPIIYPTPKGKLFNQNTANSLTTQYEGINILCGYSEGVDERIIKEYNVREISIGDYVISSGDIASLVIIDSCLRLIKGYVQNKDSIVEESFGEKEYSNLLEYPHYTRPASWKGNPVPRVLLSGNHKQINRWRLEQAKELTEAKRPDLWNKYLDGINK